MAAKVLILIKSKLIFYVSLQNMREFTLRNWSLYIWLRYTITQCLQNLPVSMKNKTIRRIIAWSNLTAIVIFMLRKWRRKTRKWNYSDAHKQYDQCQPKLIYMRLPIYQRLQRVYPLHLYTYENWLIFTMFIKLRSLLWR